VFVFRCVIGDDVVTDFTPGADRLDLKGLRDRGLRRVRRWRGLARSGRAGVVDLAPFGGNGTIRLQTTRLSDLGDGDFIF
jgi:hypothetical protein